MNIRTKKVLRDLTSDFSKTLMLILAIAVGIFGIGSILGAYSVLNREMTSNYLGTNPASATLEIESGISKELIDKVRKRNGIHTAERHATLSARMKAGDKWYPLLLFVIDDFAGKQISKIYPQQGATVPQQGAMLVERTALEVMQASIGDQILVKTPHGQPKSVTISGTVHDPGLAPAWQEQTGFGYITLSTLHWLGESQGFDQLRIIVEDQPNSAQAIINKSEVLAEWLENQGHKVHEIQVPPPNKHPHQSQMNSVLSIFTIFSFMTLLLGSILVASSLATLMVKQIRQIGVMKTIGASSAQIRGLYLGMILFVCVAALVVAVPLSRLAAAAFYDQIAVLLNLELSDRTIPGWVLFIQVSVGIIIPCLAAAFPVIRGSQVSVRTALDNYGINLNSQNQSITPGWLSTLSFESETFRLSIRNVFRQRSRLTITLLLLAAGGAMFMTALNVAKAWDNNLNQMYVQRLYDLEVRLQDRIEADSALTKLKAIPGIKAAEGWDYASTSFVSNHAHEITHTYPDKGHGSFTMLALPVHTTLIKPTLVEGKWLGNETIPEVVLNQSARILWPGVKINDTVKLSAEGKITTWNVIGFTVDIGSPALAYVSQVSFANYTNTPGMAKMLRISYQDRSRENAWQKNREVEALLEKENILVGATTPIWLLHNAIAAHMKVLVNSLLAMALLMAIVGILALTSTMSMNIMERTRELGVMRAIGATPIKIRKIVVGEGILIGVISIFFAFASSLILSYFLGRLIGNMSFRTPLSLTVSIVALVTWLAIILIGSFGAAYFPAQRANKITTREALAYE